MRQFAFQRRPLALQLGQDTPHFFFERDDAQLALAITPSREGARQQKAIRLIAYSHRGQRTASSHVLSEEGAHALNCGAAHHVIKHCVEVISESAGVERLVHRDCFRVIRQVGIRDVLQRIVCDAEILGQALTIAGFVGLGDPAK